AAAPPARGVSNRSAETPLAHPPAVPGEHSVGLSRVRNLRGKADILNDIKCHPCARFKVLPIHPAVQNKCLYHLGRLQGRVGNPPRACQASVPPIRGFFTLGCGYAALRGSLSSCAAVANRRKCNQSPIRQYT